MNTELSQIFKDLKEIEPSAGLDRVILKRIKRESNKQIREKLFLSYAGFAASLAAFLYVLSSFGRTFLNSEFWSIFSLAFSDFMVVAGSWKEYLYSLGETLPIVNIISILVPIFGFLLSANLYFSLRNKNKHIHMHNNFKFIS